MRIPLISPLVALLLVSCASPSGKVLEPVDAASPEAPAEVAEVAAGTSPAYLKLMELLKAQGYEGIGLQYESERTLEFLGRVFSDPRSFNRQIKLVYTGLQLAYDAQHQSVTIGGTTDANAVLSFLQKKVPARSP